MMAERSRRRGRAALVGGFAAGLALGIQAAPARAVEAFPPYPQGFSAVTLGRWLTTQTDVPLSSVVLTGPGYVFSFVSPDPNVPGDRRVWKRVREEVTGEVLAEALTGRSATATVAFDCHRGQASASSVIVYAGNNLQGDLGRAIPAAQWMAANPGAYLMDLAHAACDPAYRRPFAAPAAPSAPAEPPKPRAAASANRWVQVGAFGSAASANQHWRSIQQTLPTLVGDQTVRLEPVRPGNLVRALVGPFEEAEAHAFCGALKAKGGDCLVR